MMSIHPNNRKKPLLEISKKPRIRLRILLPLILAISIIQSIFILAFFKNEKERIFQDKQETNQKVNFLVKHEIEDSIDTMNTAMDIIIRDPILTNALKSKDVKTLITRAKPLYKRLKQQKKISHFSFYQPNLINLIRLHTDQKSNLINRATLKQAEQTGKPSAGLELRQNGSLVIRTIYPWRSDYAQRADSDLFVGPWKSKLIGYLEFGIDFADLINTINQILDLDLVVVVDRQLLDRQKWNKSVWDEFANFVVIDKTISVIPENLRQLFVRNQDKMIDEIDINGKINQVIILPLMDINNHQIGNVIALKDITNTIKSSQQYILIVSIASLVIGLILVILFYLFLGRIERNLHEQNNNLAEAKEKLQDYNEELQKSFHELQQTQMQLMQSEKMASIGQLLAGIAHEINNPVNFIVINIDHAQEYVNQLINHLQIYQKKFGNTDAEIEANAENIDVDFLMIDLPNIINSLKIGTDRIRDISKSLRTFFRADLDEKIPFDIHEGLESTMMILKHRLKANENRPAIAIIKNYGLLPKVKCFPGQLNQVFINIIANGIDALDDSNNAKSFEEIEKEPNQIIIETKLLTDENWVEIRIKDNGMGISKELQGKIFDYLFTTKEVGKGTGLGLSISRQIIEDKHQGKLTCISSPGEGCEFVIQIPV